MTQEDKLLLHRYGAFSLLLLVMFFSLFAFVRLDRRVWNKGLEQVVNQVLAEDETTRNLSVLESVLLQTNSASSAALYIVGQDSTVEGYAMILRMTGPSGPLSGVFYTKNPQQPPVFLGVADTFTRNEFRKVNRTTGYSNFQLTAAQISFWSQKAGLMIQEVLK